MSYYGYSPREIALEKENLLLKRELDYLERQSKPSFSIYEEPEVLTVDRIDMHLSVATTAKINPRDGLHVVATDYRSRPGQPINLGYYLSPDMTIDKTYMPTVMADMHQKLVHLINKEYFR